MNSRSDSDYSVGEDTKRCISTPLRSDGISTSPPDEKKAFSPTEFRGEPSISSCSGEVLSSQKPLEARWAVHRGGFVIRGKGPQLTYGAMRCCAPSILAGRGRRSERAAAIWAISYAGGRLGEARHKAGRVKAGIKMVRIVFATIPNNSLLSTQAKYLPLSGHSRTTATGRLSKTLAKCDDGTQQEMKHSRKPRATQ
jgi:hypothetical protein